MFSRLRIACNILHLFCLSNLRRENPLFVLEFELLVLVCMLMSDIVRPYKSFQVQFVIVKDGLVYDLVILIKLFAGLV